MSPIRSFYDKNKTVLQKIAVLTVFAAAIYIFARHVLTYFAPFVLGYIISAALEPAVRFFHKKCKIPRAIASIVLILLTVLLIVFGIGTAISQLATQANNFIENLPRHSENIRGAMHTVGERFNDVLDILPYTWREAIAESDFDVFQSVAGFLGSGIGAGGVSAVRQIPNLVLFIVFTFISAFFFTKDKQKLKDFLNSRISEDNFFRRAYIELKNGVLKTLAGYVKTQLIIMSITSSIVILGLIILREPYAFLIGITVGFIDGLPLFGAGWILNPWALYHFVTGRYPFAIGLLVIYGTVFLVKQLISPKILGYQIGIHPLIVLISIYAGFKMFGVVGIIIGPVVSVCVKVIVKSNLTAFISEEPEPPEP
jgi:sporulation integral membrane protein YtvI